MARPKKYTDKFIRSEAVYLLRYAKRAAVPFEAEFARERRYSSQRLSEFAKKSPLFSEALKRFKDIQSHKLIIGGLSGKLNSTFVIFTMKNVAGWRDRAEIDGSGISYQNIMIVRSNESGNSKNNPEEMARQFHIQQSSLSGDVVELGNGQEYESNISGYALQRASAE